MKRVLWRSSEELESAVYGAQPPSLARPPQRSTRDPVQGHPTPTTCQEEGAAIPPTGR